MHSYDNFVLREVREEDLEKILEWRNSEHIRKHMFKDSIITLDEHKKWFQNVKNDSTIKLLMFEQDAKPLGVVNFTEIDYYNAKCHWGFYLGESNLPKGTGFIMGVMALDYLFQSLNLRKLVGEVFQFNEASIKFHKKLGFKEEGILKAHILKNNEYQDIILFAQFKDEWAEFRKSIQIY